MGVAENKAVVQRFLEHLAAQRLDEAFALITPDAMWWVPTGSLGGANVPQAMMRQGVEVFYKAFAAPPAVTVGRMTAEADRVVVEQTSRGGRTYGGALYDNDYLIFLQLRDGLICEIREFMDPTLAAPVQAELSAAAQAH